MDTAVPYLPAVGNIPKILAKIQAAGAPESFNLDFLKDLGFTSSQDRPFVKVLKYIGFIDQSNRPQAPYLEFLDDSRSKKVLAARLRSAFDDLFISDRNAHNKSVGELKGWFKSKTGESDSVAEKMASTFKALAGYADFSEPESVREVKAPHVEIPDLPLEPPPKKNRGSEPELGFVYRIEIHLPDTQNIDTFRAIFRSLREELMS